MVYSANSTIVYKLIRRGNVLEDATLKIENNLLNAGLNFRVLRYQGTGLSYLTMKIDRALQQAHYQTIL